MRARVEHKLEPVPDSDDPGRSPAGGVTNVLSGRGRGLTARRVAKAEQNDRPMNQIPQGRPRLKALMEPVVMVHNPAFTRGGSR